MGDFYALIPKKSRTYGLFHNLLSVHLETKPDFTTILTINMNRILYIDLKGDEVQKLITLDVS